jgi:2-polyprenyl-6-methoxyphenol hydroxylase-like FAD-dependent oxidoreductase
MLLAYLLSRRGIGTVLLESHKDFAREFRGDTFHASSLDVMDQLGLSEPMASLVQARLPELKMVAENGREIVMGRFGALRCRHPYVGVVSQAAFLDFLAAQARAFPAFHLEMEANAQELIEEGGRVRGVRYQKKGEWQEVRADLVVAADGRGSRLRKAAGLELVPGEAPPMDIVWFRLPREDGDAAFEAGVEIRIGGRGMAIVVDRGENWQGGLVVAKGGFHEIRQAGLEAFQQALASLLPPFLRGRVGAIDAWTKISILAVQVGRVERWWRPGLLLIGDAAHVMSPVGGVGINYAMQDAVAAANLLAGPLAAGTLRDGDLAAVQRRREWPTRVIQKFQTLVQNRIIRAALQEGAGFRMPLPARLLQGIPVLNRLPARFLAYGVRPERIAE